MPPPSSSSRGDPQRPPVPPQRHDCPQLCGYRCHPRARRRAAMRMRVPPPARRRAQGGPRSPVPAARLPVAWVGGRYANCGLLPCFRVARSSRPAASRAWCLLVLCGPIFFSLGWPGPWRPLGR
ncbi:hypothetical protein C3489_32210 [Streptomyces sp. Ru71]|nr:hypothetical protein C3489_32210 [Streptomyces sp. Ru71]